MLQAEEAVMIPLVAVEGAGAVAVVVVVEEEEEEGVVVEEEEEVVVVEVVVMLMLTETSLIPASLTGTLATESPPLSLNPQQVSSRRRMQAVQGLEVGPLFDHMSGVKRPVLLDLSQ